MFDWFRKPIVPTVRSLAFETSGWRDHGEQAGKGVRVWETPEHDAVSLHFFAKPPDLPRVQRAEQVCEVYTSSIGAAGPQIVACQVAELVGMPAVHLILKFRQQPAGMTYQAAVTVPFRACSFVLKVQCREHGTTGIREAVLAERRMAEGEMPAIGGAGPMFSGWDPDAAIHDGDFPDHPIARLRRHLRRTEASARWTEDVSRLPRFPLPTPNS